MTKLQKEVQFYYDKGADVLYLSVGKPQKAKTFELAADFVLRLHPKTAQVIGITIVDFSRHFPQLKPATHRLAAGGSFDPAKFLAQALAHKAA